jgi:diguanylate cyclase (GGDEF)-like protein/PAS domain S-box-containing protein
MHMPESGPRNPSANNAGSNMLYRSLTDAVTLAELVQNLGEGIYITNSSGEVLDANPAFLEMVGIASLEDLKKVRVQDMIDAGVREREIALVDQNGSIRNMELKLTRPDGQVRTVLDTGYLCRDPQTGEKLYHGILVDITARKELENQLLELSIRDPLTGCYNRRHLSVAERRCEQDISGQWGCIYIDIDHFKLFNDQHGHIEGDTVLVKMSRFLMRNVRAEEPVIRIGGDEFLIVLAGASEEATKRVSDRLRHNASTSAPVAFSIGYAARKGEESFEATMHRADQQLLQVRVEERTQSTRKPKS